MHSRMVGNSTETLLHKIFAFGAIIFTFGSIELLMTQDGFFFLRGKVCDKRELFSTNSYVKNDRELILKF